MNEDLSKLIAAFRPPAFPGSYFISFEGIEGAGKSTQIIRTQKFLEEMNFRVLVLREPGGTSFGEKLRKAILESNSPIHPVAEMHLFASSRAQLLHEVTLKELAVPGTVIIYDRYIDSTMAYQGMGRGLGIEAVLKVHQSFPLTLMPHLTLYVAIGLNTSHRRQQMRQIPKDYFERQGNDFYQKLIDGYEKAHELFPNRVLKIDGERDEDEVFESIKKAISHLVTKGP